MKVDVGAEVEVGQLGRAGTRPSGQGGRQVLNRLGLDFSLVWRVSGGAVRQLYIWCGNSLGTAWDWGQLWRSLGQAYREWDFKTI